MRAKGMLCLLYKKVLFFYYEFLYNGGLLRGASPLITIRRVQRSVLGNAWVPWKTNVAEPLCSHVVFW